MIAIKPYAQLIDATAGINVLEKIELVGRTCYKSTDKIKEGSAEKFVEGLVKHGHEAMLEHANFIFEINYSVYLLMKDLIQANQLDGFNSFLHFTCDDDRWLMSGNVRAFRDFFKVIVFRKACIPTIFIPFINDNQILFPEFTEIHMFYDFNVGEIHQIPVEDLKTENEALIHCRATVKFVVDRGVSHEIVRHRLSSFAQESTRYCNYSKDQFGNQLTFIIPSFLQFGYEGWKMWRNRMDSIERTYFAMLDFGLMPEEARSVLPCSIKTELIMTADLNEWHHFFELRACDKFGKAHPQIKEVAQPLLDVFKETFPACFADLDYERPKQTLVE